MPLIGLDRGEKDLRRCRLAEEYERSAVHFRLPCGPIDEGHTRGQAIHERVVGERVRAHLVDGSLTALEEAEGKAHLDAVHLVSGYERDVALIRGSVHAASSEGITLKRPVWCISDVNRSFVPDTL